MLITCIYKTTDKENYVIQCCNGMIKKHIQWFENLHPM